MLTGNLIRVRVSKNRVLPLYLDRNDPYWLEVAESLSLVFREGIGMTRGEIAEEINDLIGGGGFKTLVHQGLAKVLEDRAEFEVVSDVPPEQIREKVFTAAAESRKKLAAEALGKAHHRLPFDRDKVLASVGEELGLGPEVIAKSLFADLKDENCLLSFDDISAQRLIDRYNVALAQAVLLRSVRIEVEVRGEKPARYRQLIRKLKFHRLLFVARGSMAVGYTFHIDGPLSLFSATNKYGLQMALFLPALLPCTQFRLTAELRWGPKREPRTFLLESRDGLLSHQADVGQYVPAEIRAFLDRFHQMGTPWRIDEATEILELGPDGVWVPDYRCVHEPTGTEVFLEILGFWNRTSIERLLGLLPRYGPARYILLVSDRLKVDEGELKDFSGPLLRFKEIPSAPELLKRLEAMLPQPGTLKLGE